MSFISKLWKDRVSDYPNKRKLTKEDGTSETVTVERAEGDIVVAGDAFNAENMNDLETRIQNGFNAVEQAQAELNEKIEEKPIIFSEFPGISANLSQNFVVKNKRVTGSATFTTSSTNGWRYTFMTINNTDLVLDGFLVSPSGTILPIVIEDGSGMKWIKFGDYAVAQGAAYTVYLL